VQIERIEGAEPLQPLGIAEAQNAVLQVDHAVRVVAMADAGMTNAADLAIDALAHVTELCLPQAAETPSGAP
jgi:hypothetical protein